LCSKRYPAGAQSGSNLLEQGSKPKRAKPASAPDEVNPAGAQREPDLLDELILPTPQQTHPTAKACQSKCESQAT